MEPSRFNSSHRRKVRLGYRYRSNRPGDTLQDRQSTVVDFLMSGRHKYIRTLVKGEVEELYNLETDPEELNNLALDPKHLAKLREMRAAMIAELKRTDAGLVDNLPEFSTPK